MLLSFLHGMKRTTNETTCHRHCRGSSDDAESRGLFGNDGYGVGGKPTVTLWADTPRVPRAKLFQKLMVGKQTIKIEVIAQADAQTKVALHNRIKSGWPNVFFGTAADAAQFLDPSNGFAADLTKLVPKNIFDVFGAGNTE